MADLIGFTGRPAAKADAVDRDTDLTSSARGRMCLIRSRRGWTPVRVQRATSSSNADPRAARRCLPQPLTDNEDHQVEGVYQHRCDEQLRYLDLDGRAREPAEREPWS